MSRVNVRDGAAILAVTLALTIAGRAPIHAHKPVTSPYTYNEHIFQILRDHCGRCHVEGGAAPMSLLSYQDPSGGAFAWAQAIREMLVSEAMPPWYADPAGPAIASAHALTSRELDMIVTWAAGGAPEGDASRRPAPVTAHVQWTLGKPDLVVAMPAHRVEARTAQETVDITVPTDLAVAKWVRAADLLPGTPTMVRRAEIAVVNGPVLSIWEPGDDPIAAPTGAAFHVPAAATLRVRIFYKKSWREEQEEKTDRSSIGLYFTDAPRPVAGIDQLIMNAPVEPPGDPLTFSMRMAAPGRVLAVRPQLDRTYASVQVAALTPSGRLVPLLTLHAARPDWPRRYWLRQPVELPAGTTIEVTATAGDENGSAGQRVVSPLQVALDIVPR